jgi:Uma2 family endonuclease
MVTNDLRLISTIEYPEEDFEPMPEGDKQRRNLSYTTEALEYWFRLQPNVYISGNLFIYYEENKPEKVIYPDLFVVFGVSSEERCCYKVWKEGKAPDFVLDVTTELTVAKKGEPNPLFYRDLGVKEYFQYDLTGEYLKPLSLIGLRSENGAYVEIAPTTFPDRTLSLHSEVLGLDLYLYADMRFRFYDPISNQILRSHSESEQDRFKHN